MPSHPKREIFIKIMAYTVYMHTTPSDKVYIGITSRNVKARWQNRSGYSQHRYFYSAIKKYGWENIHHEIIAENLSKEDACKMEIELIAKYNATNRNFGYNESTGGESGRSGVHPSLKTIEKLRAASTGKRQSPESIEKTRQANIGRVVSKETREKISRAKKGHKYGKMSPEQVERLKASLKGRKSPMLGKHQTEEAKRKIGNANRGRKYTKEQIEHFRNSHLGQRNEQSMKKVYCEETDTIYDSVADASRNTNVCTASVINVCKGRKSSVKSLHFRYYEVENG